MPDRQTDIFTDLPRGEQLAAMRRLKLEPFKLTNGRNISPAKLKGVLRIIDDHSGRQECFASQQTIASEMGCSEKTVSRVINALVSLDLITKERPHPMAPNRHRIVWNSLRMLIDTADTVSHRADTVSPRSRHSERSEPTPCPVRSDTVSPQTGHSVPQNAPLIANLNAPTNRPEEWAAMARELFNWGLKSATTATDTARQNGMTIELVQELWREAGDSEYAAGMLANWLTGRRPPPFDQAEADRRRVLESRSKPSEPRASVNVSRRPEKPATLKRG